MIKLIALIVYAYVAFLVLPGAFAVLARIVLFGGILALFFHGIGSLISFIGSTAVGILGELVTGILTLAALAVVSVSFPILLLALLPLGLLLLMDGLFCTVVCGVV